MPKTINIDIKVIRDKAFGILSALEDANKEYYNIEVDYSEKQMDEMLNHIWGLEGQLATLINELTSGRVEKLEAVMMIRSQPTKIKDLISKLH